MCWFASSRVGELPSISMKYFIIRLNLLKKFPEKNGTKKYPHTYCIVQIFEIMSGEGLRKQCKSMSCCA